MSSINWCNGPVSAFQFTSTNARSCFCREIVRLDSQYAIEVRFLFSITPEGSVTISEAVERVNGCAGRAQVPARDFE